MRPRIRIYNYIELESMYIYKYGIPLVVIISVYNTNNKYVLIYWCEYIPIDGLHVFSKLCNYYISIYIYIYIYIYMI